MTDEFAYEYRLASSRCGRRAFADVLSQHAVVMVDAARIGLERSDYVRLGGRLKGVQDNWVNLLVGSGGIAGSDSNDVDLDARYRGTVARVIHNFTDRLLEMLVDDKVVAYHELASAGEFHASITPRAERHLRETRRLFTAYVDSLYHLYHTRTQSAYQRSAVECMAVAHALGAWLDNSI
jgi:hypothetical protein